MVPMNDATYPQNDVVPSIFTFAEQTELVADAHAEAALEEGIDLGALADQISGIVALCADTNASVKRTEATVQQLAEVLKQFSEVNPQELMGLLGGIMGR